MNDLIEMSRNLDGMMVVQEISWIDGVAAVVVVVWRILMTTLMMLLWNVSENDEEVMKMVKLNLIAH